MELSTNLIAYNKQSIYWKSFMNTFKTPIKIQDNFTILFIGMLLKMH